jgi:hypothetical protein
MPPIHSETATWRADESLAVSRTYPITVSVLYFRVPDHNLQYCRTVLSYPRPETKILLASDATPLNAASQSWMEFDRLEAEGYSSEILMCRI